MSCKCTEGCSNEADCLSQAGAGGGVVRAWMRRWAYDNIDVMTLKKADRPKGWGYFAVTADKLLDDDVPLVAALAPSPSAVEDTPAIECCAWGRERATPVQPTASGMQAIKGDDYQNEGQDHKTFGITITDAWLDLHREPQPHGNMIEVYRLEWVRDRILTLLKRHGLTDEPVQPTASVEAVAVAVRDALIRGVEATVSNSGAECEFRGPQDGETGEIPCDLGDSCACIHIGDFADRVVKNMRTLDIPKVLSLASLTPAPTQGDGR